MNMTAAQPFRRPPGWETCRTGWGSMGPDSARIEQPRAAALRAQAVLRVAQGAVADRQTAAADAICEAIAQPRQARNAIIELRPPPPREPLPVLPCGRAAIRQRRKRRGDLLQRDAGALGDLDHSDPAQHVARIAAVVAAVAAAADQALRFVEMQRRDRDAAARRHLAHRKLAAQLRAFRHPSSPCERYLTSSMVEVLSRWPARHNDMEGARHARNFS